MGIVRYTVANGRLLAESRDGVAKRYVGDPLGSTAALVDTTGAITDTFTYWPYGEERTRTGTTPTPFRFGGTLGYYRDDARRTYVRARTLTAPTARWLSADPLWTPGETPFGYVANNPLGFVDPAGLAKFEWPFKWPWQSDCTKHEQSYCALFCFPDKVNPFGGCIPNASWMLPPKCDCMGPPKNRPCPEWIPPAPIPKGEAAPGKNLPKPGTPGLPDGPAAPPLKPGKPGPARGWGPFLKPIGALGTPFLIIIGDPIWGPKGNPYKA